MQINQARYYEIIRDDRKLDEFIKNLSIDEFKKLLIQLNCFVRGISEDEGGFHGGYMYAGQLISPDRETQNEVLELSLKVLKDMRGRKERAAYMYYLINNLHLFSDGNGRTSRLVYDMLSNRDFSFQTDEVYTHNEKGFKKIGCFEEKRGIAPIRRFNAILGEQLYKEVLGATGLDSGQLEQFNNIVTYIQSDLGPEYNEAYIPEEVRKELSTEEIDLIGKCLCDNNSTYSIGGLTMLILSAQKGRLAEVLAINAEDAKKAAMPELRNPRLIFKITYSDEDLAQRIFEGWTKEDYLNAIEVAKALKKGMYLCGIKIFTDEAYLESLNQILGRDTTREK